VVKKFNTLTSPWLTQGARDRIIERVMALDESPSCIELMAAVGVEAVGRERP
jgi:hypothetical protein